MTLNERKDAIAQALADYQIPQNVCIDIILKHVDWSELADLIPFDDTAFGGHGELGSFVVGCAQ